MKIITNTDALRSKFNECCENFDHLEIMVAWVGDPRNQIPFEYLRKLKSISAIVGTDFNQTNPDGILFLKDINAKIRIVENNNTGTFHPKIYIFSNKSKKAMFIGSSNLTYFGFGENIEVNVFLDSNDDKTEIIRTEKFINDWKSDSKSIPFRINWLKEYRKKYNLRLKQIKTIPKKDETYIDETFGNSPAWIGKADWNLLLNKVAKKLKNDFNNDRLKVLDLYSRELKTPFRLSYFNDMEKRKMIWGDFPYWSYGRVGASGHFKGLIKGGSNAEKNIIIKSINNITMLQHPLNWEILKLNLNKLTGLGFTMKSWGRLLTILRPDLFCTVSSTNVRKNLAETLNKSYSFFETVEGYITLIKLIHSSPWFNSPKPSTPFEKDIWKKRVALIDVILY